MKRSTFFCIALAAAGAALPSVAFPQVYPQKPITIIVPTGAGGSTDVVARLISNKLGEVLGQPVVVVNKAGAGGVIGTQAAAAAAPDGHTILVSTNQIAMVPHLFKKAPFDPVKDFAPVTTLASVPMVLVAGQKLPISAMSELLAYARRNPGALSYGSAGNGSPNHLLAELLNKKAGIKILHVPYKGIAAAVNDVMAGTLSLAFVSHVSVKGLIDSGRLKVLGVTSAQRVPLFPTVPAIAETVPGYEGGVWLGVWAVANTPAPTVGKLLEAAVKTLADPEIFRRFAEAGLLVETRTPAELDALLRADSARWSTVVEGLGDAIQKE